MNSTVRCASMFAGLLLYGLAFCGEASEPVLHPSAQLYKKVSVNREKYGDVIWDGKKASPEEMRDIARKLEADIALLDDPLAIDLAEGSRTLRYRRVNLMNDLVRLNAWLGETDTALSYWRKLVEMDWSPRPESIERSSEGGGKLDPAVAAISKSAGFADIDARYRVAEWWSKSPSLRTSYREQLPVDERIAGVSLIWTKVRDGFVWFDHVPDLDWDKAYREALVEAVAAPDTQAYYQGLMRFVARLRDGHTNVYYPKELQGLYSRPGLRTRLIDGKVIVVKITDRALLDAGVRVGDELTEIDGEQVREYAERRVRPYVSASTAQDEAVRMYEYQLLSGDSARPVELKLISIDGAIKHVSAARSGFRQVDAPQTPLFHLRSDGIAVLRAQQFSDDAAYKAMMSDFSQLDGAKGIIVDLRGNGGGSTNHGTNILAHFSRAPLPEMRSDYRESTPLNDARSREPYIEWRRNFSRVSAPYAPQKQFDGAVVVLIDARTFSAAEDTAGIFKLMRRGKIIGTPSGGSTGQPLGFELPGGGTARICVKRDTYPDGSTFVGSGVQPDIVVAESVADVRSGRDAALERAIAEISGVGKP